MKKKVFILATLSIMLVLAACSPAAEPVEPTVVPAEEIEPAEQPVEEQESEPEMEPTPEPETDPMDVVRTVLNDPQVIFWEDTPMMDENTGANFGQVAIKQLSEDGSYYQFKSNDDGAYMIGNVNFLDTGDFRGDAQAVLLKFQPENVDGLNFTMYAGDMIEVSLNFEGNQPHIVVVNEGYQHPYSDYSPTNLTLQSDKWYWALMAFDANGNYSSIVWEDGKPEEAAYCLENVGDQNDIYKNKNWHLTIAFGSNQTFNIQEYSVMDFDGFAEWDDSNVSQESEDQDTDQGMMQDPMAIVNDIIVEPQVLYQDSLDTLPDRGFTEYSEVDTKNPGDGFEFVTGENNDGFSFLTPLLDVVPEGHRKDNMSQAVLIGFKTNNPTGLRFNLAAQNTVSVAFENGGMPDFTILGKPEIDLMSFEDQIPTGFTLEANKWYYAFIAVDIQSNLRSRIWAFDDPDNYASYEIKLVEFCDNDEDRAKYWQQNWNFSVTMGNNSQFNIQDFRVLDFDTLAGLE